MNGRKKTIDINGRPVSIKELTVKEIDQWLADREAQFEDESPIKPVDFLLFDGIHLDDVVRMADISADSIRELAPSEIEGLISVCREVNTHFFGLWERLFRPSNNSAVTAVRSLEPGTP